MTQEDKELLLKDLCARLPYNTHIFTNSKHHIRLLTISNDTDYDEQFWINGLYDVDEVKPYLRPMSSMTEKEAMEYANCVNIIANSPQNNYLIPNPNCVDWLNKHHFDYRGLIEKGLAIEAPEGMYTITMATFEKGNRIRNKYNGLTYTIIDVLSATYEIKSETPPYGKWLLPFEDEDEWEVINCNNNNEKKNKSYEQK